MGLPNRADNDDRGLNERAGTGIFHRAKHEFKRHPISTTTRICAFPDDSCHATVDQNEMRGHAAWHRRHAEWDENWQDKVEFLETVVEHQGAELVTIKGQMALFTELLGPALDRILHERETP